MRQIRRFFRFWRGRLGSHESLAPWRSNNICFSKKCLDFINLGSFRIIVGKIWRLFFFWRGSPWASERSGSPPLKSFLQPWAAGAGCPPPSKEVRVKHVFLPPQIFQEKLPRCPNRLPVAYYLDKCLRQKHKIEHFAFQKHKLFKNFHFRLNNRYIFGCQWQHLC